MERTLRNRLTFGPIMLAVLIGLLWLDYKMQVCTRGATFLAGTGVEKNGLAGVGLLALLLLLLPPAVYELTTLFTAERVQPYRFIAAAGAASIVTHAFLTQFQKFQPIAASSLAFLIVAGMLFAALRRAIMRQTSDAIHHMAGTVLVTLYLGGLAWFLMALRVKQSADQDRFHGSTLIIVMILLAVKFTDIGAYFGGRLLGRHKLIPWLSPGKTWEGLFFGLLTAGLVGLAFAPYIRLPDYQLPWWKGMIFGMVIGGVGQLGDLLESMMKRDAEVKDSGTLIPGFGGVLDVIDSPLLAAPFAYLMFSLL